MEQRILQVGSNAVAMTIITACELFYGAWKSSRRQENLRLLQRLQHTLPTLHTTEAVAEHFGRWKAQLESKGTGLDDADLWIAAIAQAHGCALVTNNTAHFARLPELRLENWLTPS